VVEHAHLVYEYYVIQHQTGGLPRYYEYVLAYDLLCALLSQSSLLSTVAVIRHMLEEESFLCVCMYVCLPLCLSIVCLSVSGHTHTHIHFQQLNHKC
jgi:hypothetical protein